MYYQSIPLDGDGRCLFRSVAYALFGTKEEHGDTNSNKNTYLGNYRLLENVHRISHW